MMGKLLMLLGVIFSASCTADCADTLSNEELRIVDSVIIDYISSIDEKAVYHFEYTDPRFPCSSDYNCPMKRVIRIVMLQRSKQ